MSRLINSFKYAGQGLRHCITKEKNFQLHCIAAVMAVIVAFMLNISSIEWMIILICITLVIALEMINTAIEHCCNMVQPDYHPMVKIIKDVSAGAVLITAAMTVVCGAIIFIPKIIMYL